MLKCHQIKYKQETRADSTQNRAMPQSVWKSNSSQVGLGESSFLLLEYSVEYLIEYSSTRQGK